MGRAKAKKKKRICGAEAIGKRGEKKKTANTEMAYYCKEGQEEGRGKEGREKPHIREEEEKRDPHMVQGLHSKRGEGESTQVRKSFSRAGRLKGEWEYDHVSSTI